MKQHSSSTTHAPWHLHQSDFQRVVSLRLKYDFLLRECHTKKLLRVELLSGTEENVRRKRWFACSQNRAHALFQTLLTGLDKQDKGVKITNLITLVNQLTCLANHVNDDNSL